MATLMILALMAPANPGMDFAQLRELLHDRQDPRGQSQAALLLVQSTAAEAERLVRQGLRHVDNEEAFLALAAAVRMRQDPRFTGELVAALLSNKPRLRQAVAEALAVLPSPDLLRKLEVIARDEKADIRVRQTALWAMGRTGRHAAAGVLVGFVDAPEDLRRIALPALSELTGLNYTEPARWKDWWARNKDLSHEKWLDLRLNYQSSRAARLEGELLRSRAQVLRLHQQLYARLPVAERYAHLQVLREHEDPGVRALAVVFSTELLPTAPPAELEALSRGIVRLSEDSHAEVQRAAVLALGRLKNAESFGKLKDLLATGPVSVRVAAARALAAQSAGTTADARARQKQAVPLLQKALEDPSLEVVAEAAEAMGSLGASEAGPVLTSLLRHSSDGVRQTAAQALERTADSSLADGLLAGLEDGVAAVRFSLVGAVGKALCGTCSAETRKKLLTRLETAMKRDPDAGVRGRAATVLGESGGPEQMAPLWETVQVGEGRVQEKAWEAMGEVIARAGSIKLLESWDRELTRLKQGPRRIELWSRAFARWDPRSEQRDLATAALEGLAEAQADEGKWAAALPHARALMGRRAEAGEAERSRVLKLLLRIGQQALAEGHRAEALRIAQDARPYLTPGAMTEAFEALRVRASGK
jgi:HEAT repeat protein